ncbi:REST corepressor 3-like isoform X3 [Ptychodera flava]|uniref:REST corepressor 3-like isoform X3 n=1 Tax=Ptychodera flava TaxID=63121 RepID=UPI00396A8DCA
MPDVNGINGDEEEEPGMRVGEEYQACVPEVINDVTPGHRGEGRPEALLVWAPTGEIADEKLDEYIKVAKEKHGYNTEQALGMLFWHRHDIEKSLSDLPNFTPFPDEWTVEDKVLFEQAFSFHGKSFHRIRQMLPDKSISCLVKYYYSWKKTRTRTSLMDRQARKLAGGQKENSGSDDPSDEENVVDSDFDPEHRGDRDKHTCSNCQTPSSQIHSTPKGSLCNACYSYWRRTGVMRTNIGPMKNETPRPDRHNPVKSKRKPPRGMYLDKEDLIAVTNVSSQGGDVLLKHLDTELVSLKKKVQLNKQILSQQKDKFDLGVDDLKSAENGQRNNARWTNDELLIAVQAVRKYGRNYQAIADVVGNKTVPQVRSFFVNYRRRFNLDQVIEEYEAEHGVSKDSRNSDDEQVNGQSNASPIPASQTPPIGVNSQSNVPPPLLRGPTTQPQPVQRPPPPLQQPTRFLQVPRSTPIQQPPPLIRPTTAPSTVNTMSRGRPPIMAPLAIPPPQLVGSQRETPPHTSQ